MNKIKENSSEFPNKKIQAPKLFLLVSYVANVLNTFNKTFYYFLSNK